MWDVCACWELSPTVQDKPPYFRLEHYFNDLVTGWPPWLLTGKRENSKEINALKVLQFEGGKQYPADVTVIYSIL